MVAGVILLLALAATVVLLLLTRPSPDATPDEIQELLQIFGGESIPEPRFFEGMERKSRYVSMRDGVNIAVDVLLPKGLPEGMRLPAVFIPTRYWRSWDLRFGLDALLGTSTLQRLLVTYGYAVVLVDARGSGASFGSRKYPWSPDELRDYAQLMDWAISQPWCDGALAATGISYSGTCAEFMAGLEHPALKAVIPQFSLYDTYTDIAYPGGVFNLWFVQNWSIFNRQLDDLSVPRAIGPLGGMLVRGPRPVPPKGSGDLEAALKEHKANVDILMAARQALCRDDVSSLAGVSIDAFSPHTRRARTEAGGAAFYSWAGWHDGAYAQALLHRFTSLRVPHRAVIGPWNHGAVQDTNPFAGRDKRVSPPARVRYLEQIRFLDYHCKGKGTPPALELLYYTMGRDTWSSTRTWPPKGTNTLALYAGAEGTLTRTRVEQAEEPQLQSVMPPDALGTGKLNRWRTQIGRSDVFTPPRPASSPGVLTFTSAPLPMDMECTGTPVLRLRLRVDRKDASVFAYIEDVPPREKEDDIRNVTEGCFRLVHRAENSDSPPFHSFSRADLLPVPPNEPVQARFTLLPTSYLFKKGHRIRLSLSLQDDEFQRTPLEGSVTAHILLHNGATFLTLPVKEG